MSRPRANYRKSSRKNKFICSARTSQLTHSVSVIKTNQSIMNSEIIAVCSQIHSKHINTLWAERRIVNVKLVVRIVTTGL